MHKINNDYFKNYSKKNSSVWIFNSKVGRCIENIVFVKESITSKRSGAKFCSLKCKNSYHSRKRTKNRRDKIKIESRNLNQFFKMIPKNKFRFSLSYRYEGVLYSNRVLNTNTEVSKEVINSIVSVQVKRIEVMRYLCPLQQ